MMMPMGKPSMKKSVHSMKLKKAREGHGPELKLPQASPSQSSLQKTASIITFIQFLILLFVSFAVYWNALSGAFVYDDKSMDVSGNISAIFFKTNYYRPLLLIIVKFLYHFFSLDPWWYHLVNILFHCGTSVIVFLAIRRLLNEERVLPSLAYLSPPFIAALLFASHPIHTEAVAWNAGFNDVALTFFYLLSFYFYVNSEDKKKCSYIFSVISFAFAVFLKEPALTLPVVLLAYDFVFARRQPSPLFYVKRYAPFLIIGAIYLALRMHALGHFAPQRRHVELNAYQYAINIFPIFIQYLQKLLFPVNLNAFYKFHPILTMFGLKALLSLVGTAVFAVFMYISAKKNRVAFLGFMFITAPLLPVLYIRALGESTFGERYLYLPSVGYVLLIAVLVSWLRNRLPRAAKSIPIVVIIILGLYTFGTITRNSIWKDDFTLWADTVKKSPNSAEVRNNLGLAYAAQGQFDRAIAEYQTALQLKPDYATAHYNVGIAYASQGQFDRAITEYQTALRLSSDFAEVHNNLGFAYASQNQFDRAIAEYQSALRLKPDYAMAHYNLGIAYASQDQFDRAIAEYQAALRLYPDLIEAHNNLGAAYASQGQFDRAIADYQAALRLNPDLIEAHFNLGIIYASQGQFDRAIAEYQTALRLSPDDAQIRQHLNDILSRPR
jgi:protein O-mannosyl-transferase